jgi:hypothetical protein
MLVKPELPSDHDDRTTGITSNDIQELIVVVAFAVIGLAVSLGLTTAFVIWSDSAVLFAQLGE